MDRLNEALATLIQSQAVMQANQVYNDKSFLEIRKELGKVIKILNDHTVILQKLPEAIR